MSYKRTQHTKQFKLDAIQYRKGHPVRLYYLLT